MKKWGERIAKTPRYFLNTMTKTKLMIKVIRNILLSKVFNLQRPIQVSFAVTNRCNLKCAYCYGDYSNRGDRDFTLEELKKIFRYLKKIGIAQIYLTGGEPLLRKDIGDVVDYLRRLNIDIGMVTNGTIAPNKLNTLKKINHLIVSIDGNKKENDKNRGIGTYDKITKAISLLHKNRINFSLKAVFNKYNIDQLDYLLDMADRYGTKLETIIPYENFGDPKQYLTFKEKKKFLNKILAYKKRKRPIMFDYLTHKMSSDIYLKYKQSIIFNKKVSKYPKCLAGMLYLFIDANGGVYPCNQLIGNFKALNIRDDGMEKAIKNAMNKKCDMCCIPFLNEKKYLFSLNPKIIFEKILSNKGGKR